MAFPPTLSELTSDKIIVPNSLFSFLTWMSVGDTGLEAVSMERVVFPSSSDSRHVLSFEQDMIHCVSRGQLKTPKHVALPLAVKHMTVSTQVITLLNRFGNGLSAPQVSKFEMVMAESVMCQQRQHADVFVPSNISPLTHVTFCWDYNVINEETLSGAGTTHCTNGIVIQRQVHPVCWPPPPQTASFTESQR